MPIAFNTCTKKAPAINQGSLYLRQTPQQIAELVRQILRLNVGMHTRLLAVAIERQARLYESLFRQGCEEGIFETEHPLECAEFILAGIQFLTDMGIYPWAQEDLMRRAMAFPALVEAQLKAPKGSFSFLVGQM
jgi:hypothetical protein